MSKTNNEEVTYFDTIYDSKGSPTYGEEGQKTATDVSQKDDCDLRKIVNNYLVGGSQLPIGNWNDFDLSNIPTDFYEAQEHINSVQERFINSVPAEVRAYFNHNPTNFYKFAMNPLNQSKLEKWGIIAPKVDKVEVSQSQADTGEQ